MPKLSKVFIFLLGILYIKNADPGTNVGAYLTTPDPSLLEYRLGNGLGYIGNGWDDAKMANLSTFAGYDGQRKKLPEQHFENWGYGIELGDAQTNTKLGILDVVGYLATPIKLHSSNETDNSELCYPANLYEPIWLADGSVNPKTILSSSIPSLAKSNFCIKKLVSKNGPKSLQTRKI